MLAIAKDIVPGGHYEKPVLRNGVWRLYDPPTEYTISLDIRGITAFTYPWSAGVWSGQLLSGPAPAKPQKPAPLPVRQSAVPIYGWRTWEIEDDVLASVTMGTRWEGPVLRADGPPDDHNPHAHGGTHGIYSYRTARQALNYGSGVQVVGRIVLSGRVVRHTEGFRAEVATMDRLYVPPRAYRRGRIKALRDRYQCPVYTDWRKFARKERNDGHR
jgi:hypothetical protein